jgi:transposase-like protein
MEPMARKSDGRRMFTPEFKRQQIERVLRGEVTIAELSRELQIVQVTGFPDTRPSAEHHAAGVAASSSTGTKAGRSSIPSASRSA